MLDEREYEAVLQICPRQTMKPVHTMLGFLEHNRLAIISPRLRLAPGNDIKERVNGYMANWEVAQFVHGGIVPTELQCGATNVHYRKLLTKPMLLNNEFTDIYGPQWLSHCCTMCWIPKRDSPLCHVGGILTLGGGFASNQDSGFILATDPMACGRVRGHDFLQHAFLMTWQGDQLASMDEFLRRPENGIKDKVPFSHTVVYIFATSDDLDYLRRTEAGHHIINFRFREINECQSKSDLITLVSERVEASKNRRAQRMGLCPRFPLTTLYGCKLSRPELQFPCNEIPSHRFLGNEAMKASLERFVRNQGVEHSQVVVEMAEANMDDMEDWEAELQRRIIENKLLPGYTLCMNTGQIVKEDGANDNVPFAMYGNLANVVQGLDPEAPSSDDELSCLSSFNQI